MLVNEYRLNLMDRQASISFQQQMEEYFFGEGSALPRTTYPPKPNLSARPSSSHPGERTDARITFPKRNRVSRNVVIPSEAKDLPSFSVRVWRVYGSLRRSSVPFCYLAAGKAGVIRNSASACFPQSRFHSVRRLSLTLR